MLTFRKRAFFHESPSQGQILIDRSKIDRQHIGSRFIARQTVDR